jgi:hypothetical protein
MMKSKLTVTILGVALIALSFTSCKKDDKKEVDPKATTYTELNNVVTVNDKGQGTGTMTWVANKTYVLDGLVFVNSGQTLTIEAGTVIKGKPGQEENASAFIVARGGKVIAVGTADKPIIFTAEADQLTGNIPLTERGLWGGVILLGSAGLNSTPGESAIEGIPTTETRGLYGGSSNDDNSGTLKYISIRHGGTDIGEGNEINGLTLGGVGSGTTIDYIEVVANADDGVEFFGGMPRAKHILVSNCGDDCYDYDEGYRGYGQFWVAVQDPAAGDRMGEHDGGTDPETAQPYAVPNVSNATYIGRGVDAGKKVITFRDNAGGKYYNSIFANQSRGIDIELLKDKSASSVLHSQCSYSQLEAGNLVVKNSVFFNVKEKFFTVSAPGDSVKNGNAVKSTEGKQLLTKAWTAYVSAKKTDIATKYATFNNQETSNILTPANPIPSAGASGADFSELDSWFTTVTYKGAFEPGVANHWAKGWTLTYKN